MKMDIGEKIRIIRLEKGFSQEYIATKLGMAPNNISRWERKGNKLSLEEIEKVAIVFGMTLWEVLLYKENLLELDFVKKSIQLTRDINANNNEQLGEYQRMVFKQSELIIDLHQQIDDLKAELETFKQTADPGSIKTNKKVKETAKV
jgi:transcriptional regulator with XRE-family HTH domain